MKLFTTHAGEFLNVLVTLTNTNILPMERYIAINLSYSNIFSMKIRLVKILRTLVAFKFQNNSALMNLNSVSLLYLLRDGELALILTFCRVLMISKFKKF